MSVWTQELCDEAKRIYVVDGYSASVTARIINTAHGTTFSRNAVIGKLARLGILGTIPERSRTFNRLHRPKQVKDRPTQRITYSPSELRGVTDLEPTGPVRDFPPRGGCQFMTGEPGEPDWRMCGRPGYPWCPEHRKIVFQPQSKQASVSADPAPAQSEAA
jgi:hypothetical protein